MAMPRPQSVVVVVVGSVRVRVRMRVRPLILPPRLCRSPPPEQAPPDHAPAPTTTTRTRTRTPARPHPPRPPRPTHLGTGTRDRDSTRQAPCSALRGSTALIPGLAVRRVVRPHHEDVFGDVLVECQLGTFESDAEGGGPLMDLHDRAGGEAERGQSV